MNRWIRILTMTALVAWAGAIYADSFSNAARVFKNSDQSASYFTTSYGYALFPTVGEGGFVVGGAYGKGRVYAHGAHVGNVTMTQLSVGAQAGGQAFSQIVFFENKAAFDQFTSGNFEFGATASAVAITAAAHANAGTTGANAGASTGRSDAATMGVWHDGMAVFNFVKGGAMVQAVVSGEKFAYTPIGH